MYQITSFYHFFPIPKDQLESLSSGVEKIGRANGVLGLILIGTEGINTSFAAPRERSNQFKTELETLLFGWARQASSEFTGFFYKDSASEKPGFWNLKVQIRDEIVTIGRPDFYPKSSKNGHLPPREWDRLMKNEDVIVLDTRNSYECEMGRFQGAKDLDIKDFRSFPTALEKSKLPKDKKYLIYCTGGIRCEKAIFAMNEQGYEDVHQLDGGIINYFKESKEPQFEGECFVFDQRISIDKSLQPTGSYKLCPHCGDPGQEKITCVHCGLTEVIVCKTCLEQAPDMQTCSKNCSHHHRLGHKFRRPHMVQKGQNLSSKKS